MPPTVQQVFDLAFEHHEAGRLAEAEKHYRQILALQPRHAESLHHLGILALQVGDLPRAVDLIHRAVNFSPDLAAAHSNLGEAFRKLGRTDEAIASYRRALELQPELPEVHNNLGLALATRGQEDLAVDEYRQALRLRPDYPEAWNNLGIALRHQGELDEAEKAFRQAIELQPDVADFHNSLAITLGERGQTAEAIAAHRRASRLPPYHAAMHGNLVYMLQFDPSSSEQDIRKEQQNWNRQFSEPVQGFIQPHGNDRDPERRLRVGYVSPDFRDHVIGRNLVPLFRHHDRQNFEIFCYAGVLRPDFLTEQFRCQAAQWRDTMGVQDGELADLIRQDDIDILIDLSQHLANNRLPVFARQPAPVQVSFAGYPASAGVPAIDHRISDRYLEPDFDPTLRPAERVFLLDSFWCYDPGKLEVAVSELPASTNGHVTFGSLNVFSKTNEPILRLWGRILAEVRDSRLLLLTGHGTHRQRAAGILQQQGVDPSRVEFIPRQPRKAYLELYQRLDIVLDPFPYNGHTTSLDALWMGVPVVSLVGTSSVARAGLSQLSNLGLPELAAFSENDYLQIATTLAQDLPRLRELRSTLRARMQSSLLMDAPRFTHGLEAAYRAMWRQWCSRRPSQ
jgi:predicted O-linked N-acetylglucosamine transferase (SPINDLY family)